MAKKNPTLTVDGVFVKNGKVLLVKRAIYPYSGYWVLPGGRVEHGERIEDSLKREMREELSIRVLRMELIGVYSDPKRDPREHRVTAAFLIRKKSGNIKLNYEANMADYFPLDKLPAKIGFDHRRILEDCKKLLHKGK